MTVNYDEVVSVHVQSGPKQVSNILQRHWLRLFVLSHVDCCCSLLVGSLQTVTDNQRVMNAATCVITNTGKFK